jgi:hypothetical protein
LLLAVAFTRAPKTTWRRPDRHELLGELLRAARSEDDATAGRPAELQDRRRAASSAPTRPPAQSPRTAARGGREPATAPDDDRDAGAAA